MVVIRPIGPQGQDLCRLIAVEAYYKTLQRP